MKKCPACGLVFPDESTFCFLSGDTLESAEDSLIGTSLDGRYRLESLVGQTSWGRLYAGRHRLLMEPCTIKVLMGGLDDGQKERFHAAVELARRCTHANVAELVAGGITAEGIAYLVHPQRVAQPLSVLLNKGPLSLPRALGIAVQILRALGRVHDFGAVHGNLRPSNVMVGPAGHVELVDVGLGRSLVREPWENDPHSFVAQQYLAPELSSSQRVSISADIYAVGVTTFHMLSGTLPIDADDVKELRAELSEEPTGPLTIGSTPEPIARWVQRMIERFEPRRPEVAQQALTELLEACKEAGVTPEVDPGESAPKDDLVLDTAFTRWDRFSELFGKMVTIGFPSGAPEQVNNSLQMIQSRVEQLRDIGKKALYEHGTLRDVIKRAREGRRRIADQMDGLHDNAMVVRKELQPLRVAADSHGEKAEDFPGRVRELHREVLRWEGRSGFMEPHQELATAYREIGDLVDKWWAVRNSQLTCEQDADDKKEVLREVEAQLEELRSALKVHESNLAAEVQSCEQSIGTLGRDADKLEFELLDLSSRFSAPLRSKPELGPCFRELAQGA
jgi:serine/threonine protein kinase